MVNESSAFYVCYLKSDFRFIYLTVCSLSRLFKDPNKPSAHIEGANKGDVTYQVNKGIGHNSDIFVYGCYYFDLVTVHILKLI